MMRLLLIRHADAGDAAEFARTGKPDSLRPLSKKGIDQMRAAAAGLVELVPDVGLLVTSPYTRAVQTANLVREAYGELEQLESETLEPERAPSDFVSWIRGREDQDVIACVGHEPHLSSLATWLICGSDDSRVVMKKGGACLVEFDRTIKRSEGVLRWLMGAKQLAAVGE